MSINTPNSPNKPDRATPRPPPSKSDQLKKDVPARVLGILEKKR